MKIALFIILIIIIFEIYYKYILKQKNKLSLLRLNHIKNLYHIHLILNSCNSYIQLVRTDIWARNYIKRYQFIDKKYKYFKEDRNLIEKWVTEKRFSLNKPTKQEIESLLEQSENRDKFLRKGQWLFNELYKMYPNFINTIRGSEYDPFYDDNRINKFINYILNEKL